MANASEAKSIPPPEYSPIAGPKFESAPSEDTCSQGHALVEPKEPPAMTANAARVMRIRKAPPASLTQVEDTSVDAHSTRDAQVKQDGNCSGTDRPYACPVCHVRYYSVAWLRRHIVCHEREKTLKCDQCGRSYKARSALARHRTHVHGLQSPGIALGPSKQSSIQ